jgi:septal ring-binding cell division protein DamX
MSEKTDRRLKFGRIKMAIAIGVGLALVPAALFAATTTRPIDGIAGIVREQAASPTATAKAAATTAPTAAATAKAAATTAPAAPKSGSGGFLGQDGSSSSTMTILLLVAAAASVAVAGRMVTRRR